ncbi:MAG: hypothetical protein V4597_11525 [Pseudomonadota bacterium]
MAAHRAAKASVKKASKLAHALPAGEEFRTIKGLADVLEREYHLVPDKAYPGPEDKKTHADRHADAQRLRQAAGKMAVEYAQNVGAGETPDTETVNALRSVAAEALRAEKGFGVAMAYNRRPTTEAKDALGHGSEKGDGGGGGDEPPATRSAQVASLRDKIKAHQAEIKQHHEALKTDARAALATYDQAVGEISDNINAIASDPDDPDPGHAEFGRAYGDLETLYQEYDSDAPIGERVAALKELGGHAGGMLALLDKLSPKGEITQAELDETRTALQGIVAKTKTARGALKDYVNHRRELRAIKDVGEALEEEVRHKGKGKGGGQFIGGSGGGGSSTTGKAAGKLLGTVKGEVADVGHGLAAGAQAAGQAEHAVRQTVARNLDRLPGPVARGVRRVWNVSIATFSAGYDAVKAYGVENGKSPEQAERIAGIVSTVDTLLAKPAVLVAELAGIPGLSFVAGMVPIASAAYLGVAAVRHPRKVLKAAHAALGGFLDRVKDPEKYKATATKESKDSSGHEHKGSGPGGGQFTGGSGGGGGAATGDKDAGVSVSVFGDKAKVHAKLQDLFGPSGTPEGAARAAGAPAGAEADVSVRPNGTLLVEWSHEGHDAVATRIFSKEGGSLVCKNQSIEIGKKARGRGLGTQIFTGQVKALAALGVTKIVAEAARSDDKNGYYTWARLGYDGAIPAGTAAKLPAALKGAKTVQELLLKPGGLAAWKEHGETFAAEFGLAAGSASNTVFGAYLAERRKR